MALSRSLVGFQRLFIHCATNLNREHRYLVLKVHVRSKRKLPEIAVVEHLRVNKDDHPGQRFVRLISDSFEVIGPHGTHTCLLYPPAGLDMSDCMQCLPGETLTVPLLRAMVRNILLALDYLHQANIIHTGTFRDLLFHVTQGKQNYRYPSE